MHRVLDGHTLYYTYNSIIDLLINGYSANGYSIQFKLYYSEIYFNTILYPLILV